MVNTGKAVGERHLGERQAERYRMQRRVGWDHLSRPNKGSGHWSQSPFGSFQSAARLKISMCVKILLMLSAKRDSQACGSLMAPTSLHVVRKSFLDYRSPYWLTNRSSQS